MSRKIIGIALIVGDRDTLVMFRLIREPLVIARKEKALSVRLLKNDLIRTSNSFKQKSGNKNKVSGFS